MAKPDMSVLLGIKKKPAADEPPPGPPGMDAAPDEPDADQTGGPPDGDADNLPGGGGAPGDLTPDMLDYHGGSEGCGGCSMFTAPSTCSRWPDPVEENGWCRGFMPMAKGKGGPPGVNLGPMGPGGPPAGPPAGPPGGPPQ